MWAGVIAAAWVIFAVRLAIVIGRSIHLADQAEGTQDPTPDPVLEVVR